jgi:hypothetical protein
MSQSSNFSSTTVHLQKSHNIHFSPSSALAHRVYKRSQSPVQNSYHTKLPTELPTSHTQTKTPYKTPYQTPLSTLQQTPTQQQATLTPTTKCPAPSYFASKTSPSHNSSAWRSSDFPPPKSCLAQKPQKQTPTSPQLPPRQQRTS